MFYGRPTVPYLANVKKCLDCYQSRVSPDRGQKFWKSPSLHIWEMLLYLVIYPPF